MKTNKGCFKKGNIPWNKGMHGIYSKDLLEKMSKAGRGKKASIETRKKMSESHKGSKAWNYELKETRPWVLHKQSLSQKGHKLNKGSFKKGITPWNKDKKTGPQSLETKLKRSASLKGINKAPKTPEHRKKLSLAKIGTKLSIAHKRNIVKSHNLPAYKERIRRLRLHQVFPKKDTKPERMMQIALTLQKIKFEKHVPIEGQPDIFIKPNVCLFIDGDYWHANPKKYDSEKQIMKPLKAKDIWARDSTINHNLNKKGFHVIRIWESDIKKDVNKCSEKIIAIIKQVVNSEKTVTIR